MPSSCPRRPPRCSAEQPNTERTTMRQQREEFGRSPADPVSRAPGTVARSRTPGSAYCRIIAVGRRELAAASGTKACLRHASPGQSLATTSREHREAPSQSLASPQRQQRWNPACLLASPQRDNNRGKKRDSRPVLTLRKTTTIPLSRNFLGNFKCCSRMRLELIAKTIFGILQATRVAITTTSDIVRASLKQVLVSYANQA